MTALRGLDAAEEWFRLLRGLLMSAEVDAAVKGECIKGGA